MIKEQEKVVRQQLIALFDRPALKSFYELRPGRVIWTFTHIWLGLAIALALGFWAWRTDAWWPKAIIPLLMFYIGTRLNAFAVQVHEAAHNLLFESRQFNDTFCNLFGAYWVLNDVESYRRVHLVHHTDLHLDSDPDRDLYELSATAGRFQIAKLILQDVFWITAIHRIISYLNVGSDGGSRNLAGAVVFRFPGHHPPADCHGAFLAGTFLSGWPAIHQPHHLHSPVGDLSVRLRHGVSLRAPPAAHHSTSATGPAPCGAGGETLFPGTAGGGGLPERWLSPLLGPVVERFPGAECHPAGSPRLNPSPRVETEIVPCCVCGSQEHVVIARGRDFEYDSCANEWAYVRCAGCGHHYLRERPSSSALTSVYPPNYGNYSNSARPTLAFRIKARMEAGTLRKLAAGSSARPAVFDVGCGDGRLLDGIKAVCPGASRLAGCEISSFAAENARRKGYEVAVGSFESLDFAAESFDLIFLVQVMEHLADPPAAIKKIAFMLRPGGRVVIETPSTDCWDFRWFHRRYLGGFHFQRHFNLFVRQHLERLLRNAGLEAVSSKVKLQPVHWVWTAHHWLMEKGVPPLFYRTFNIKNPFWLAPATLVDAMQVVFFGRSSNMQVIACKPVPLKSP
ncbi:MAG: methyltransferase domain-containing protein [Pedosphaera sp.]|nr:methyltransferase domain-containing protein [Pedosphaera sp.]